MIDCNLLFRQFLIVFLLSLGIFPSNPVQAETGVQENEIIIGMSNALSVPASDLGIGIKQGAQAYFDRINQDGGVHGRKITVISQDDGYEPKRTFLNTTNLISESKVFAYQLNNSRRT